MFQTEIRLRELQLDICKDQLAIGFEKKNEEDPAQLAIRQKKQSAVQLTAEVTFYRCSPLLLRLILFYRVFPGLPGTTWFYRVFP